MQPRERAEHPARPRRGKGFRRADGALRRVFGRQGLHRADRTARRGSRRKVRLLRRAAGAARADARAQHLLGGAHLLQSPLLLHRPKGRKIAARHRRGTRRDRGAGAEVQDARAGLAGGRHSARLVHERCGRRPQSAYRPQPAKVHVHPSRKHGHRDHLARIFRQDRPRDRQTALRARRGKRKSHLGNRGEIRAR